MKTIEILKNIKDNIIGKKEEQLHNVNRMYFGLEVEVYDTYYRYEKNPFYRVLSPICGARLIPRDHKVLKKLSEKTYQDIKTMKIYNTTDSVLVPSNLKIGEHYIYDKKLFSYKRAFPDDTRQYLTSEEIDEQLISYYNKKVKQRKRII